MQVKFLPIAFESKTAATDESTPPDRAHNAFLSPIFSFNFAILSSTKEDIIQSPEHLQILNKKFLITCVPFIELLTSGWNWIPYKFFSLFSIAAFGQDEVCPMFLNPSGTFSTKSVWLIKKPFVFSNPSKSREELSIDTSVVPYSLLLALATLPPNVYVISCIP